MGIFLIVLGERGSIDIRISTLISSDKNFDEMTRFIDLRGKLILLKRACLKIFGDLVNDALIRFSE